MNYMPTEYLICRRRRRPHEWFLWEENNNKFFLLRVQCPYCFCAPMYSLRRPKKIYLPFFLSFKEF